MATPKPATPKQLAYLRSLAARTGTTFTYPDTSRAASAEIKRLQTIRSTGHTFAELERHQTVDLAGPRTCAVQDFEVTGYGSTATWAERA